MLACERPRVPAESVLRSVLLDEQSRSAQVHPGVPGVYVLKKQKHSAARGPSPLGPHGERLVARPQTKPQSVAAVDWARSVLGAGGVLAAVPACGMRGGAVALDGNLASGNAAYWATQLLECSDLFRTAASTECMGRETVAVTAVTLQKVPDFLPEGDVYAFCSNLVVR